MISTSVSLPVSCVAEALYAHSFGIEICSCVHESAKVHRTFISGVIFVFGASDIGTDPFKMKLAGQLLLTLALVILNAACGTCARKFAGNAMEGFEEAANLQLEHLQNMRDFLGPPTPDASKIGKRESTVTFRNPRAQQFFVDGTKIPDGE